MKLYMNKVLSNGKTLVYIDIVFTNHIEDHNFQMGSEMKSLINELRMPLNDMKFRQ
jgi:hypothetical protein